MYVQPTTQHTRTCAARGQRIIAAICMNRRGVGQVYIRRYIPTSIGNSSVAEETVEKHVGVSRVGLRLVGDWLLLGCLSASDLPHPSHGEKPVVEISI